MVKKRHFAWLALWLCLPMAAEAASRLTLQDGTTVTGDIIGLSDGIYRVAAPTGEIRLPAATVLRIETIPEASGLQLRVAGSTTIGDELMPALLESYARTKGASQTEWKNDDPVPGSTERPDQEVTLTAKAGSNVVFTAHVSRQGTRTGFKALAAGKAAIGMASRPVNDEETAILRDASFPDPREPGRENVLALDGLAILVNKQNSIFKLSLDQIAGIYSGTIKDWSEVDGSPGPIHVLTRDHDSGTADTFQGLVLKKRPLIAGAQVMASSDDMSNAVAADPQAIGYAGFAYVHNTKAVEILTACGLQFQPSEFYVRTEEYPLSRRLFLYTRATASDDEARRFIDFALSAQGQEIAAGKDFVDLAPHLSNPSYGATRVSEALGDLGTDAKHQDELRALADFNAIVGKARRATITYRFRTGVDQLDSRAVRDIDRLVAALKSSSFLNRKLYVVGFSDSQGHFPAFNQKLSLQRAQRIAQLLQERGIRPEKVVGFGRMAPVGCNSTPEGMEKNRRVEIWVR